MYQRSHTCRKGAVAAGGGDSGTYARTHTHKRRKCLAAVTGLSLPPQRYEPIRIQMAHARTQKHTHKQFSLFLQSPN